MQYSQYSMYCFIRNRYVGRRWYIQYSVVSIKRTGGNKQTGGTYSFHLLQGEQRKILHEKSEYGSKNFKIVKRPCCLNRYYQLQKENYFSISLFCATIIEGQTQIIVFWGGQSRQIFLAGYFWAVKSPCRWQHMCCKIKN